jgi:N-methylhydantoinase A
VAVARALGIRRLLIPPHPGLLCAQGLLASDDRENFVAPMPMPLSDARLEEALERGITTLSAKAERWFIEEDVLPHRRVTDLMLDLRYVGQNFELSVPLGDAIQGPEAIAAAFHAAHDRTYGFHNAQAPVELVCMRLVATARLPHAETSGEVPRPNPALPVGERRVVFTREDSVMAPVYDREALHPETGSPDPPSSTSWTPPSSSIRATACAWMPPIILSSRWANEHRQHTGTGRHHIGNPAELAAFGGR